MRRLVLTTAKDAGNRGCEAIVKGIGKLFEQNNKYRVVAYSENIDLDRRLGVGQYSELKSFRKNGISIFDKIKRKARVMLLRNEFEKEAYRCGYAYKEMLKEIDRTDIALSTGGDLLCYGINELFYINKTLYRRGVDTVLWGCSIGKENLTPEKEQLLKTFKLIVARESITYDLLISLGLKNVYCYPDPAFTLDPEKCEIPKLFGSKVIGINLSNFVGENVGFDSIIGRNICGMLDSILKKTDMHIVLIPHVFWDKQDDRVICNAIYEKYKYSERIHVFNTEHLNYQQIRYVISKFDFFVGARTHAMISAYATAVPALALGYSVKARGIARDLGIDESFVVNVKGLKDENVFSDATERLINHEGEFRSIYERNLTTYKLKAFEASKVIEKL